MGDPVCVQLLKQIGKADNVNVLRSLRDQVHEHMKGILQMSPVEQFNEQLNELHDSVICRSIILAEAEMARLGMGSPPVPYAYLLFGSGGRQEQTLSSDQDSGIVFEDSVNDSEEAKAYFQQLTLIIVSNLQQSGYPLCEGNVLSNNPEWCMSLSEWKVKLNGWFAEPAWEAVRYLLIMADGRSVYGDHRLAFELKDHYFNNMIDYPNIIRRMLDNTMRHKVLLGLFGHLLKEQYGSDAGSLDIKYGAYIPLVNAIRLLAIQMGIRDTSTLSRIRRLAMHNELELDEAAGSEQAFRLFLRLRLMTTEQNEDGLYANNGKLSSRNLSREMTEELKSALRHGKRLQRKVFKRITGRLM
jgi:CBS domain-containing protein